MHSHIWVMFYAITLKDEMFIALENYHEKLIQENMKAAQDKSHFFLTQVKFLGHIIERNTITPLKYCIDAIQKLQTPSNKKKLPEFLKVLNFLSKCIYKIAVILKTILQHP